MRIFKASLALGAAALIGLSAGLPAIGQQQTPESILPPGFGDPLTAPAPTPTPTSSGVPLAGAPADNPGGAPPTPLPTPTATPAPPDAAQLAQYEMPDYARRSLDEVGAAGPEQGGLAPDAFGHADGRYVEALMRRLDMPIASRWLEITLRRALVSRLDTPPQINGADFAAERAWLLLRMGEANAAQAVVQGVDADNYTPKLYEMAMQTALATGDPAQLCGIADAGAAQQIERGWVLARAMCAGLAGKPALVAPIINAARKSRLASGVDLLLAQKVAGAGSSGRQAVTIEWDGVDRLTAWRYGLAMATAVAIPDDLLATAGPQVSMWRATSPVLAARDRVGAAEQAAVRGVFSNAALVDLYGAIDPEDDRAVAAGDVGRDLSDAYGAPTVAARLAALKQLWNEPKTADGRYARLILTARAAARIPAGAPDADADRIVASMLCAGLDRTARRWGGVVPRGGDAWAMLTLADPTDSIFSARDVSGYSGRDDGLKQRLFFAGMAGLRRLSIADIEQAAESLGVPIGAENAWTRAIDDAARRHEPGMVVLLSATGMQTAAWRGVPPEALYHIVAALRAVGLAGEARMIAAEAIARA